MREGSLRTSPGNSAPVQSEADILFTSKTRTHILQYMLCQTLTLAIFTKIGVINQLGLHVSSTMLRGHLVTRSPAADIPIPDTSLLISHQQRIGHLISEAITEVQTPTSANTFIIIANSIKLALGSEVYVYTNTEQEGFYLRLNLTSPDVVFILKAILI